VVSNAICFLGQQTSLRKTNDENQNLSSDLLFVVVAKTASELIVCGGKEWLVSLMSSA